MGKIAKYLAQAWPATLIVFLLLVVQAFCDLRHIGHCGCGNRTGWH
jgi:hypothetical protein